MAVFMLLKMLAVVAFSPLFMGPSIVVAAAGYIFGNIFVKAQLSVKREMSKARAPVLGHFGATISGISQYSFGRIPLSTCLMLLFPR